MVGVLPLGAMLLNIVDHLHDLVGGFQNEKRFGFEETVFLLLFGDLPTTHELRDFNDFLGRLRTPLPGFVEDAFLPFPSPDIMNQLARSVLFTYRPMKPSGPQMLNYYRRHVQHAIPMPSLKFRLLMA